jgi:hypothetical protein
MGLLSESPTSRATALLERHCLWPAEGSRWRDDGHPAPRLRVHLLLATVGLFDRFTQWAIGQAERDLRRIQQHFEADTIDLKSASSCSTEALWEM